MQHAVIAVADAQPVLERFDVDVGRLGLDRAGDDLVHQPDHRRLARQVFETFGVLFKRLGGAFGRVGGGRVIGIQAVERRIEFDWHADQQRHRQPRRGGDGGGHECVERIGDGDQQTPGLIRHRQRASVAEEPRR